MHINVEAIVCSHIAHGEHGAIVRLLTKDYGLKAGYVAGGQSRKTRPILIPGNLVAAQFKLRTADQLPSLSLELIHSRAPLLSERLPTAAIFWLTALTAAALPENQPHPTLFTTLDAVLTAIESADNARLWAPAIVRYELLMLSELGFALELNQCAATGSNEDLIYVSPKSSKAVSRSAGMPYAHKLLPLPPFLINSNASSSWDDITSGLRMTRYFLNRDILNNYKAMIFETRDRLEERIARISA